MDRPVRWRRVTCGVSNSWTLGLRGAISVSPGVWLYQITEEGLALELALKGTRFFKDDKLNAT